ncbi:hypothetical protein [Bacillus sp. T33-2]|uniref:hypothetical protein n=1 Tax=Bacillus sp. T33-2 TaxID=2054168 RepID=UPI000C774A59|nr:hypothetical protein [Bacillus sp. T33-2]PLR97751.1 hypothetical protein CVD19_09075 [Bacillus sp. T33-2]
MGFRIVMLFIGFSVAVFGGVTIIAYLNFLIAGHEFRELFSFIVSRPECYALPAGIVIIGTSIFPSGKRRQ